MAIKSTIVGPGTLKFTAPSAMDISTQVTKCEISPKANRSDSLTTLSGESISGTSTYTAELTVSAIQDLTTSGFVAWSYTNAGKEGTFEYKPNTAGGATVTGKCVIDPVTIGGEVGSRATSEFTFDCPSLPTFKGGTA